MSITGKIREKSILMFIIVGVAMLLFIVDPSQVMNWIGQGSVNDSIGEFEGNEVSSSEWGYDRLTQGAQESQKAQIWNRMIQDSLYNRELNKIGLVGLAKGELNALIWGEEGVKRHAVIESMREFADVTGQFNEDTLYARLPLILENPASKAQWSLRVEPVVKTQRNRDKYLAMIKNGLYVTSFEVKSKLSEVENKIDFKYAYKSFASIADSTLNITDSDLQAYYDAHKTEEMFKQNTESRTFDYIEIEVLPDADDKAKALDKIESFKEDFATTENDSLFVSRYAETSTYNNTFLKSNEFPSDLDSILQVADSGALIGPYESNGFYKMSKIRDTKPQKEATVRHILLSFNNNTSDENDAKIKAKSDSILRVIKSKNNFEEMVTEFSEDPGSVTNGGKYEWFPEGQMVPEFNDFSFDKAIGSLGIVKTSYGYHIIENLDRREAKTFQVATVDVRITPLQASKDRYYDKGLEVYEMAKTKSFEETLGELGYASKSENINLTSPSLSNPNLKNSSEVLRWAFNADVNDVSEPFALGDIVVVACVKSINEEGVMSFENAKQRVESKVIAEKKAALLKSQVEGVASVEGAATKFDTQVKEQFGLTYDKTSIASISGNENEAIGAMFGIAEGETKVIEGKTGVFVVTVTKKSETPNIEQQAIDVKWPQMLSSVRSRANSSAVSALNKQANVKDYRKRLEFKNRN